MQMDQPGNGTSPRKIEANRRNARKSTGARTTRGKLASRSNAIKHGILSSEIVIRTGGGAENPAEFQQLLQGLTDYFQPLGIMEELLVQKLAMLFWRQKRATRFENAEIRRSYAQQDDKLDLTNFGDLELAKLMNRSEEWQSIREHNSVLAGPALEKLLRYEAAINRQLAQTLMQLERLQRQRNGEKLPAPIALTLTADSDSAKRSH
jgi:hypothetical protein